MLLLDTSFLLPRPSRCVPSSRTKTSGRRLSSRPTLNVFSRYSSALLCLHQSCGHCPGCWTKVALSAVTSATPPFLGSPLPPPELRPTAPVVGIKLPPRQRPQTNQHPMHPPRLSPPRLRWWSPPPPCLLPPQRLRSPRSRQSLCRCLPRLRSATSSSGVRSEDGV